MLGKKLWIFPSCRLRLWILGERSVLGPSNRVWEKCQLWNSSQRPLISLMELHHCQYLLLYLCLWSLLEFFALLGYKSPLKISQLYLCLKTYLYFSTVFLPHPRQQHKAIITMIDNTCFHLVTWLWCVAILHSNETTYCITAPQIFVSRYRRGWLTRLLSVIVEDMLKRPCLYDFKKMLFLQLLPK